MARSGKARQTLAGREAAMFRVYLTKLKDHIRKKELNTSFRIV